MMHLNFQPEDAHLQLSSECGTTLSFSLKLKSDSSVFALKSELSLSKCIFVLTVFPLSQSPYAKTYEEDGRFGEFQSVVVNLAGNKPTKKESSLYKMWLQVPDDQFNTIYFEASKQNLPYDITIGVDDDNEQPDGLTEGVYDDISIGKSNLALRFFLFTLNLSAAKDKT